MIGGVRFRGRGERSEQSSKIWDECVLFDYIKSKWFKSNNSD